VRSQPSHQKQNDQDDKNDANDANAAVAKAVPISTEPAAKAAQQKDDKNDDEYQSDRHDLSPFAALKAHVVSSEANAQSTSTSAGPAGSIPRNAALFRFDRNAFLAYVDLDAGRLLLLLVELIADNQSGNRKQTNDQIKHIAIHG
jgi:hypothetical protein